MSEIQPLPEPEKPICGKDIRFLDVNWPNVNESENQDSYQQSVWDVIQPP